MQVEPSNFLANDAILEAALFIALMTSRPRTCLRPRTYASIISSPNNDHFHANTGYTISQFEAIHHALKLPDPVRTHMQDCVDSKTAFFMLCAWLRNRLLRSLEGQYGWSHSRISRVVRHLTGWIYRQWGYLLDVQSPKHSIALLRRLDHYAAAVNRKFGLPRIWGAIDGTVRLIARPVVQEELVYNGHKRTHALKYQIIALPDGLMFCSEPFVGRRHDAWIVAETGLVDWAERHAKSEDGQQMYLYGDQAYSVSHAILTTFRGNIISSYRSDFNYLMGKYRVQVEWAIGMVPAQWPRFSVKRQQKSGASPIGQDWMVAVLLLNAKTCVVGNQIGKYMHCNPPELDQYFSSPRVRRTWVSPDPRQDKSGVNLQEEADDEEETMVEHVL